MKKYDFNFIDIVEHAKDVIIVTRAFPIDPPGPEIVYVNRSFTELTGYTADEVVGKNPRILQSGETDRESTRKIREALIEQKPVRATLKNFAKSGEGYWLDLSILPLKDEQGKVTHFVAIERDVSKQKALEDKLNELSRTDALTGVLNRRAFDETLAHQFSRFKRAGEKYSLLLMDIDHFKAVNDNYGHNAGDDVLMGFANTCRTNIRNYDALSRLGGEEFCILLPHTNLQLAEKIAEKLRQLIMDQTLSINNDSISITVSIGVSEVEESDQDSGEALKRADVNLYRAKENGRNRVESK